MEAASADLERLMEAVVDASKIAERGMKEASKKAKVKSATVKSTAFLLFLAVVHKDRCTFFYIVINIHGYS